MQKNGVTINKILEKISLKSQFIFERRFKTKHYNCSVNTLVIYFITKRLKFCLKDFESGIMLRYSGSFVPTKDMIKAIEYCESCLKLCEDAFFELNVQKSFKTP